MTNQPSDKYAFFLGHVPALSRREIIRTLEHESIKFREVLSTEEVFLIEADKELDVRPLQARLGGVIKIANIINYATRDNLEESVEKLITTQSLKLLVPSAGPFSGLEVEGKDKKFQFGFSLYGNVAVKDFQNIGLTVKRKLKERGINARFVVSKEKALSSVIVKKERLIDQGLDLVIVESQGQYYLGQTFTIQDFKDYSARDYGRPSRDHKSGMLPPKLAKIMINLAGAKPADTILDPFCGSGTVLQEALMLGYKNLIGSDISAKAVEDAKNNLNWLKIKYQLEIERVKIYELDVRNLEHKVGLGSVDTIITEPYLGEQENSKLKTKSLEKLGELYIDAFSQFYKVLKTGGRVVIVLPIIQGQKMEILSQIEKIGFTLDKLDDSERGSIIYGREGQRVEREIFVFKKPI